MKRLTLLVAVVALFHAEADSSAQQHVDRKGITSTIKLDQIMTGYLTELNGKYKLRLTQSMYEPGGYVGDHQHLGPGIRCLVYGERTDVSQGKTTVHKAGDCWYTPGDVTNSASNRSDSPARVLNFEILPADLEGPSVIPPRPK
jgi:quercetin dioxygenase-like cupin family protein